MSYFRAILIVVAVSAIAAIASTIVDRNIRLDARKRHHEVGNQVFQLIGVLFSVLLAFVFNEVWSQYNSAAQAIQEERSALHGAAMLANALPREIGQPIIRDIQAYTEEVIGKEWLMMRRERRSSDAADALRTVIETTARSAEKTSSALATRSELATLLDQAHAARETRTFQLTLGLPAVMWVMLTTIALVLVAFVVLSGTEPPGTVMFAAAFTGAIGMVLVLVWMLDYPFEGALALGDDDFVALNAQLAAMLMPP